MKTDFVPITFLQVGISFPPMSFLSTFILEDIFSHSQLHCCSIHRIYIYIYIYMYIYIYICVFVSMKVKVIGQPLKVYIICVLEHAPGLWCITQADQTSPERNSLHPRHPGSLGLSSVYSSQLSVPDHTASWTCLLVAGNWNYRENIRCKRTSCVPHFAIRPPCYRRHGLRRQVHQLRWSPLGLR